MASERTRPCVCERTCLSSPYHLRGREHSLRARCSQSLFQFRSFILLFRLSVLAASSCCSLPTAAAATAAAAVVCRGSSTGKALLLPPLPTSPSSSPLFVACGPFGHSVEFSRVSVKTQPTAIWWHIRSMATVWITGARFVLLSHIISGIIVIGIVRSI